MSVSKFLMHFSMQQANLRIPRCSKVDLHLLAIASPRRSRTARFSIRLSKQNPHQQQQREEKGEWEAQNGSTLVWPNIHPPCRQFPEF